MCFYLKKISNLNDLKNASIYQLSDNQLVTSMQIKIMPLKINK